MVARPTRRRLLLAGLAACAPVRLPAAAPPADPRALAEQVRDEMAWAWDNYAAHAWGLDEFHPVSGGASCFPLRHQHVGLSLIEALDTLWLMGLDGRFAAGVAWVRAHADWNRDGEVSVFETSIRLVGGLLSAHLASGEADLLRSARDLADRLLPAFRTPTGIPYARVNLRSGQASGTTNSPAGAGTYLLEWGLLSRLTGDPRYAAAAKRALVAIYARRSPLDLVGQQIDVETGQWRDPRATVGSYGDSFFETLWDAWQFGGDRDCLDMYRRCTAAIRRHQRVRHGPDLWFADVDMTTGRPVSTEQDELAAFYGGLLAQGGDLADGAAYTDSWARAAARFGVLPETYDYARGTAVARGNALRPELADAAFTLWLVTRDPHWRAVGAAHFAAMRRWQRAPLGYTGLADVVTKAQADHCPGYWWSEQMKYYWLLFADTPRFDYRRNTLSTEGNVLAGLRRGQAA